MFCRAYVDRLILYEEGFIKEFRGAETSTTLFKKRMWSLSPVQDLNIFGSPLVE